MAENDQQSPLRKMGEIYDGLTDLAKGDSIVVDAVFVRSPWGAPTTVEALERRDHVANDFASYDGIVSVSRTTQGTAPRYVVVSSDEAFRTSFTLEDDSNWLLREGREDKYPMHVGATVQSWSDDYPSYVMFAERSVDGDSTDSPE
jgi:hypothetical protein